MLTFKIKPNDEVTLKQLLCPKAKAWLDKLDFNYWGDKSVVVVATSTAHGLNYEGKLEIRGYIRVRDRRGEEVRLPVECISRSYALRRNHKRYSLHNKTLIVE